MYNGELEVCALLRPNGEANEARLWLAEIFGVQAVLSAALSIMHPELYDLGRQAMLEIWKLAHKSNASEVVKVAELWPGVYNSLSAMVNRRSPYHKDRNGLPQWFDLVLTVGSYDSIKFEMPELKIAFHYPPGTVIAFSGRRLEHGVGPAAGDRSCIVWYMQEKVHQALKIHQCNFAHVRHLEH